MLCSVIAGAQEASLAVVNARVWTGNAAQPWAEALAAKGDTILAVGDSASIQKRITSRTRVLDAHGGMVTPGFIDSHVHFLDGGLSLGSVQLRDARGKEEFVTRIKAFAASASTHGCAASPVHTRACTTARLASCAAAIVEQSIRLHRSFIRLPV